MRQITITYPRRLFDLWKKGKVHEAWFLEYRDLFDQRDFQLADGVGNGKRPQHQLGYHFAEWFTAIHFWKKGYRVLLHKYGLRSHLLKFTTTRKLLGKAGMTFLQEEYRPDLLVYDEKDRYFFFVEVKRETDRLRKHQEASFRRIGERFNCPVFCVELKAR
jgi:VRR-NUC domain